MLAGGGHQVTSCCPESSSHWLRAAVRSHVSALTAGLGRWSLRKAAGSPNYRLSREMEGDKETGPGWGGWGGQDRGIPGRVVACQPPGQPSSSTYLGVGTSAGSLHGFLRNEDFLAARKMESVSESMWCLAGGQEPWEESGGVSGSQARSLYTEQSQQGPRVPGSCHGATGRW